MVKSCLGMFVMTIAVSAFIFHVVVYNPLKPSKLHTVVATPVKAAPPPVKAAPPPVKAAPPPVKAAPPPVKAAPPPVKAAPPPVKAAPPPVKAAPPPVKAAPPPVKMVPPPVKTTLQQNVEHGLAAFMRPDNKNTIRTKLWPMCNATTYFREWCDIIAQTDVFLNAYKRDADARRSATRIPIKSPVHVSVTNLPSVWIQNSGINPVSQAKIDKVCPVKCLMSNVDVDVELHYLLIGGKRHPQAKQAIIGLEGYILDGIYSEGQVKAADLILYYDERSDMKFEYMALSPWGHRQKGLAWTPNMTLASAVHISNCNAYRSALLKDLRAAGIDLFSYGSCLHNTDSTCVAPRSDGTNAHAERRYVCASKEGSLNSLYFGIPNTLRRDLTTERYYHALASGAVVVWFGDPDIVNHGIPIVKALEYASLDALVSALRHILGNKKLYESYTRPDLKTLPHDSLEPWRFERKPSEVICGACVGFVEKFGRVVEKRR